MGYRKIALIFLFILMFSFSAYGGHGPIAEEQPQLSEQMNNWKKGDAIPKYLLVPDSNYNPMSMHTPRFYINATTNTNLLSFLLLHPGCPEENSAYAFSKIIELKGLAGFVENLKTVTPDSTLNIDKEKFDRLQKIFSDKCITVYWLFIDFDDLPKNEAVTIFEDVKKQIDGGKPVLDVYQEKSQQYEYHPADCPQCTRTKIGNGGSFHLSKALDNVFPEYFARFITKGDIAELLKLKMRETMVIEQKRSKEDDETRKKYGKDVAIETDNRLILYTVIDYFEPEK